MSTKTGKAWKMERASVSPRDQKRPRSNKFRDSDGPRPAPRSRTRVWVGGYSRGDSKLKGHYRMVGQ